MKATRLVAGSAAAALALGTSLVVATTAQAGSFGPSEVTVSCAVYTAGTGAAPQFPSNYTDDFELTVDPENASSGSVDVTLSGAQGLLNGPIAINAGGTIDVELVLAGGQTGTVTLEEDASYPAATVPGNQPSTNPKNYWGAWSASGSFTASSADLTTVRVRTIEFNAVAALGGPAETICSNEGNQDPKADPGLTNIQASINGDTAPPTDPPSSNPVTTTPAPPPPTEPAGQATGQPKSASAVIPTVYCNVNGAFNPDPFVFRNWPAKLTVKPGDPSNGDTVEVEVELDASAENAGPSPLEPGGIRFEAQVEVGDQVVTLRNGPTNKGAVPAGVPAPPGGPQPIFADSELPLVAKGKFTAPGRGDYRVRIRTFIFNGLTDQANNNDFDTKCNANRADAWGAPKAFAQPRVVLEVSGAAGPATIPDGDETGTGGTEQLAETGPNETLILALAALIVLQVGLVLTVRAVRSRPSGRHL